MRSKYLIPVLLLSLVLISSCGPKNPGQVGPFKGGTNGILISFVPNYPPSKFDVGESVRAQRKPIMLLM